MQPWFLSPTLTDEHNPFAELTCPRVLSRAITVTWLGPPLLQGGHVNKPSHSRLHVAAIRLFPRRRAESGHIVDKSALSGRWVSRERERGKSLPASEGHAAELSLPHFSHDFYHVLSIFMLFPVFEQNSWKQ